MNVLAAFLTRRDRANASAPATLVHKALRRPVALLLALASLALVTLAWHAQVLDRHRLLQALAERNHALAHVAPAPVAPARPRSFVDDLPATLPVDEVLHDTQRLAAQSGLSLQAVEVAPQAVTAGALHRTDLTLTLHGGYGAVVGLMAELSDRTPGLVIRQLSIARAGQEQAVDARLSLALAARPPGP